MDVLAVKKFEITAGGMAKSVLFAGVDGLRRSPEIGAGAGADFDKNQDIAATADQVDFTP